MRNLRRDNQLYYTYINRIDVDNPSIHGYIEMGQFLLNNYELKEDNIMTSQTIYDEYICHLAETIPKCKMLSRNSFDKVLKSVFPTLIYDVEIAHPFKRCIIRNLIRKHNANNEIQSISNTPPTASPVTSSSSTTTPLLADEVVSQSPQIRNCRTARPQYILNFFLSANELQLQRISTIDSTRKASPVQSDNRDESNTTRLFF